MAGKSSQSNNRGSNLFGYFVSGKFKEYHTQQFAAAAIVESGMTASGGVINDYALPLVQFTEHISLQDQVFLK